MENVDDGFPEDKGQDEDDGRRKETAEAVAPAGSGPRLGQQFLFDRRSQIGDLAHEGGPLCVLVSPCRRHSRTSVIFSKKRGCSRVSKLRG